MDKKNSVWGDMGVFIVDSEQNGVCVAMQRPLHQKRYHGSIVIAEWRAEVPHQHSDERVLPFPMRDRVLQILQHNVLKKYYGCMPYEVTVLEGKLQNLQDVSPWEAIGKGLVDGGATTREESEDHSTTVESRVEKQLSFLCELIPLIWDPRSVILWCLAGEPLYMFACPVVLDKLKKLETLMDSILDPTNSVHSRKLDFRLQKARESLSNFHMRLSMPAKKEACAMESLSDDCSLQHQLQEMQELVKVVVLEARDAPLCLQRGSNSFTTSSDLPRPCGDQIVSPCHSSVVALSSSL